MNIKCSIALVQIVLLERTPNGRYALRLYIVGREKQEEEKRERERCREAGTVI